jgi:hypothetical protein
VLALCHSEHMANVLLNTWRGSAKVCPQTLINRENQSRAGSASEQCDSATAVQALQTVSAVERTTDTEEGLSASVGTNGRQVASLHLGLDRVGRVEGEIVSESSSGSCDHALPNRYLGIFLTSSSLCTLAEEKRKGLVAAEPCSSTSRLAQ